MKNVLVINAGSSSVKFKLFGKQSVEGVVDKIGKDSTFTVNGKTTAVQAKDYKQAGDLILHLIEPYGFSKVIHRVVHGGKYSKPISITPAVLKHFKKLIPLAPLHMPPAITLIEFFAKSKVKQVACFDTMFHTTIPEHASLYAIPIALSKKYDIKRYGFHGLAHAAMLEEAQRHAKKFKRVITCQLGNGSSVCAVLNGKSIDTSMGFTPLEGLVMGTRSGDIDPALVEFLCQQEHKSVQEITTMLTKDSGLKGLANENDVRKLLEREKKGDKAAALALDIFAHRVRKYIGAYIVMLGGVDCIILSGGISRAPKMRERILRDLEEFGILLDKKKMQKPMPVCFSKGKVQLWAIEVDEQDYMYRITSSKDL